jgi:hypothetical protein
VLPHPLYACSPLFGWVSLLLNAFGRNVEQGRCLVKNSAVDAEDAVSLLNGWRSMRETFFQTTLPKKRQTF